MRTTGQTVRGWKQAVWVAGLILCIGCGLGSLAKPPLPRLIQVAVNYLPYLVKGGRPQFPPARVLVLLPVDKRDPYPAQKGALPPSQDNIAILGIWGMNSQEGLVRISPSPERYPQIPQTLGAQRRMKAGITKNPDIPRGIFTLTDLPHIVQDALESHFQEAGFPLQKVSFAFPGEPGADSEPAQYALGCTIEQFSLVSLERTQEIPVDTLPPFYHIIHRPILGPTRADVVLALTLYRWPSGEILWEGKVADSVDDPPQGESEFLYSTPGEVMSMALSRAVGSILVTQSLQDVLLTR